LEQQRYNGVNYRPPGHSMTMVTRISYHIGCSEQQYREMAKRSIPSDNILNRYLDVPASEAIIIGNGAGIAFTFTSDNDYTPMKLQMLWIAPHDIVNQYWPYTSATFDGTSSATSPKTGVVAVSVDEAKLWCGHVKWMKQTTAQSSRSLIDHSLLLVTGHANSSFEFRRLHDGLDVVLSYTSSSGLSLDLKVTSRSAWWLVSSDESLLMYIGYDEHLTCLIYRTNDIIMAAPPPRRSSSSIPRARVNPARVYALPPSCLALESPYWIGAYEPKVTNDGLLLSSLGYLLMRTKQYGVGLYRVNGDLICQLGYHVTICIDENAVTIPRNVTWLNDNDTRDDATCPIIMDYDTPFFIIQRLIPLLIYIH
jgi:hypothetical protein